MPAPSRAIASVSAAMTAPLCSTSIGGVSPRQARPAIRSRRQTANRRRSRRSTRSRRGAVKASVMLRKLAVVAALGAVAVAPAARAQEKPTGQGFSFRTGVELINVTATVTDEHGRFVPNLKAEDFIVYEDGNPQAIQQFDSERVPVSLG